MVAEPLRVQQAISLVMDALPAIGKDERSPEGYSYRGIEQIAKHLQPLLAKHGVVITPLASFVSQHPSIAMKEGWTDTILDVEWRIYGPCGDFIEARTQGIGRDRSDKGAAKALTQARKNMLLSLFSIADKADDADGQTYEQDRAPEPARPTVTSASGEGLVTDSYALAAANPPEKPIAAMTMAELIAYGRQIGVVMSGSKADFVRTLEPYVLAATGEEPWDMGEVRPRQIEIVDGAAIDRGPAPKPESSEIAFEPVVAKPSAERLLPPDARKSVRSQ